MNGQGLVIKAFGFVQLAPEFGQAAPLQQHGVRVGAERTGLGYAELGLLEPVVRHEQLPYRKRGRKWAKRKKNREMWKRIGGKERERQREE